MDLCSISLLCLASFTRHYVFKNSSVMYCPNLFYSQCFILFCCMTVLLYICSPVDAHWGFQFGDILDSAVTDILVLVFWFLCDHLC